MRQGARNSAVMPGQSLRVTPRPPSDANIFAISGSVASIALVAERVANFLERYRGETVFLSPPQPVQRALIALLARDSSPHRTS